MTADTGQTLRIDQLVAWPFADYVFGCDWDVMSDVTKSRQFGVHRGVDSEACRSAAPPVSRGRIVPEIDPLELKRVPGSVPLPRHEAGRG